MKTVRHPSHCQFTCFSLLSRESSGLILVSFSLSLFIKGYTHFKKVTNGSRSGTSSKGQSVLHITSNALVDCCTPTKRLRTPTRAQRPLPCPRQRANKTTDKTFEREMGRREKKSKTCKQKTTLVEKFAEIYALVFLTGILRIAGQNIRSFCIIKLISILGRVKNGWEGPVLSCGIVFGLLMREIALHHFHLCSSLPAIRMRAATLGLICDKVSGVALLGRKFMFL